MNILFVDDAAVMREFYVQKLQTADRFVYAVHSVEEAHTALVQHLFDIAIIDLHIPLNATPPATAIQTSSPDQGFALGLFIRHRQPDCGIIFFSNDTAVAQSLDKVVSQLGRRGVAYCHKDSTTLQQFNDVIEQVLKGKVFIDQQVEHQQQLLERERFLQTVPEDLRPIVIGIHKRLPYLSQPQLAVADTLSMGYSRTGAAKKLQFTVENIDFHLQNIRSILFPEKDSTLELKTLLAYAFVLRQYDVPDGEK